MTQVSGALILLCFLTFVLFIGARANDARRGGPIEWRLWAFAAGVVLVALFHRSVGAHSGRVLWPQTVATDLVADLVTIAGTVLSIWARIALGRSWSSEIVIQRGHQVVERGPYAHVRHPMYSGILLMLLGAAIWSGRAAWLIVFASCFAGLALKARREERLLSEAFPEYAEYQRRTSALIPSIL
jgi:protein-S-isoprenylcysteine O-methyltransferase Ste14